MATVSVDIDIYDYIEDFDDNALLAEIRRRKIDLPDDEQQTVRTAIAQIQRGDTLDAITTLEREFFPKWASVDASRAAYLHATFLNNATAQAVAEEGVMFKRHAMVKCQRCDGKGVVDAWVNIPDECPDCCGSGQICQYPSGALAKYYGGPLLAGPTRRAGAS